MKKQTTLLLLPFLGVFGCADDTSNADTFGDTGDTSDTIGDTDDEVGTEDSSTDDGTTDDSTTDDSTTDDSTTDDSTTDDTTDDSTDTTDGGDLCMDGIINQDETDIDCGGLTCAPCDDGQMCGAPTDCASTNCEAGICAPLGCQSDAECDPLDDQCNTGTCDLMTGECAAVPANEGLDCDSGDLCMINGLCNAGACAADPVDCTMLDDACNLGTCDPMDGTCAAAPANEGGDCGDLCTPGAQCLVGACMGGNPVDCTMLDDACNVGACDVLDGSCYGEPANEGQACNDGEACTLVDSCTAGVCTDPNNPDGYLFAEDFSDNAAVWTLGTNWAIGNAVAGCGDPGADHTPTNDNGVAGVVLGGCAPTTVNANFFCLTSPAMDSSALATVHVNYWRDLWSDYTPYMKNKIEVWNGIAWVIIYETFGAPEVNDAAWTNFSYNISAHKNAAMQVRWCYNVASGGAFNRGSWNVDDVTIGAVSCTATP